MRTASVLTFALTVLSAACATPAKQHTEYLPAHPETGAAPLFVLMATPNSENILASELPGVIVAGWKDGLVVFSRDPSDGGPPFATRVVDPKQVAHVHDVVWNAMEPLAMRGFGPFDVQSTVIFVAGQDRSQWVCSSHEHLMPSDAELRPEQREEFDALLDGWSKAAKELRSLVDPTALFVDAAPTRFQDVAVAPIR